MKLDTSKRKRFRVSNKVKNVASNDRYRLSISRSSKNMRGNKKNGPYGASKAAVNSLTATLALELAPKIRVNAIAPGPIPTENFKDSMNMHTEEREKELKKYIPIPLNRWGSPEDIGAAVVFMASNASSWVTGQCLFVDGGT